MGDPTLRFHFQDVRNYIDSGIYKPWGVVFNKLGTGFNVAYKNHTDNLPTHNTSTAGPDFFKDYVMAGAVAWLAWGGPQGLILVPIVNGINLAFGHLNKKPRSVKVESPAIDLTPAEFQGSLTHVLETAFTKLLQFIDACIRHADAAHMIPLQTSNDVWKMIGLSPSYYLPRDWDQWNAGAIAEEFERQLWVTWSKNVADDVVKKKSARALGSYNYKKALGRLATVTKGTGDGWSQAFANMERDHPDHADYDKLNTMHFVKIRTWAVDYKPLMKFDHPLPGAVVSEMQRLSTLSTSVDQLLLGRELIRVQG